MSQSPSLHDSWEQGLLNRNSHNGELSIIPIQDDFQTNVGSHSTPKVICHFSADLCIVGGLNFLERIKVTARAVSSVHCTLEASAINRK